MTARALLEFAEGLARVAASGGGPTALVGHLAKISSLGVMLEDAQWQPLATAGPGSLPATSHGLSDDVATVVPVSAGGPMLGSLSLFGAQSQRAAFGHAARLTASAIAVEMARDGAAGPARKRAFWDGLLAASYHDFSSARADAAARGITLCEMYVCVALDAENGMDDVRAIATTGFRSANGELTLLDHGGTLLVLIPAPREVDAENAKTAARLLKGVRGGVSRALSALDLHLGVREAASALAIAKRLYREPAVATHADLGAYPLIFSGASVEDLRALAARTLAPLRAYDEKHQTELERTLRRYFSTGMNVKDTATDLNVHRHTVFYRLRQIADISGTTLESEHDQLTLRLAIAIDALHT